MTSSEKRLGPTTLENVRIIWRNFSGKEGRYNAAGDRNFHVLLNEATAKAMERDGWNVKWLEPREEGDEPKGHIQVKVKYGKGRPPRVVMVTSRGRTELGEDEVNILDWAEIKNVDMILNPSYWDVNGKQGISAYLRSIYVTIEEDELDLKYADVPDAPDSAQNVIPADPDGPPWN